MNPSVQHKNTGLQLFITKWISRHNHETTRDEEESCMCITTNAIEPGTDIPGCMAAKEKRTATLEDEHIGILSEFILDGWPSIKAELQKDLQQYWSF